MAVQAVHIQGDAFLVCVTHSLSTEREEVMGLCIGEVNVNKAIIHQWVLCIVRLIVHIHSVIILRRSDKRKDRVEISPEQLSAATTENTHRLAEITGRPMRVVGWYHSHPHITVWPSHVDVRTQAMYQMMDVGFVGLIFSCFIEDKNTKTGRILYTCFQSVQAQKSSDLGHLDSITKIHNGSVFTKNLCGQMSAISGPLLQWLEDRLEQNQQRAQELQSEKEQLLQELKALG
uniref:Lys-63-specific deubiquitinase BRCC36 n=1 Tax=Xenopus tropicalis TaxID=8364 RepID=A0A6I8RK98_XENTR